MNKMILALIFAVCGFQTAAMAFDGDTQITMMHGGHGGYPGHGHHPYPHPRPYPPPYPAPGYPYPAPGYPYPSYPQPAPMVTCFAQSNTGVVFYWTSPYQNVSANNAMGLCQQQYRYCQFNGCRFN